MDISEIKNKEEWEGFVAENAADSFLHSWNWGEFNRNSGEKIWRLGFWEAGRLEAAVLVIKVKAKRGVFLFIPHGPVIRDFQEAGKIVRELKAYLTELGQKEGVAFVRISPLFPRSEENLKILRDLGFRDAPVHMMHPETTWILDIDKDEETVLKEMRKTHRNLIRRAEKDGVTIEGGDTEEYLKAFYDIHMETVRRHHFVPFSYDYMKGELDSFKTDDQIRIFNARYQGKVISSAIIVFYGQEAFYHHGASSSEHAKVPSSYLALWEAIREARRRGMKRFNFYGIVDDNPKHPWYGLSRFKKGFGGHEERLVHCQDLPLSWKYRLTYAIELIRKIKRGY